MSATLVETTPEISLPTRLNNGYENMPRFFVTVNDALLAEKPKKMTEQEYIAYLENLINNPPRYSDPSHTAGKGCLEFLKQVHASGRKISEYHAFYFAAKGGHRRIMDWVEETFGEVDDDTGVHACGAAAGKGRLEIVEYLFGRGFRIDISQYRNILYNDHLHVVKWMIDRKINLFYPNDNIESLLQDTALKNIEFFITEQKMKIPQERIDWAARNQQVEALKVLAKHGYYPSKAAFLKLFNGVKKEKYINGKLGTWYREDNIEEKATDNPKYTLVHYFE